MSESRHQLTNQNNTDFNSLPDEVIEKIFRFLRPEIILSCCSLVFKRFLAISENHLLWQFKHSQHFGYFTNEYFKNSDNNNEALTSFKDQYELYPKGDGYLVSCVIEGDVDSLKKSNITLKEFNTKMNSETLFTHSILTKNQSMLDYLYKLAMDEFGEVDKDTYGRDIYGADDDGHTLLFWAAYTNQIKEIVRLTAKGAQVNQADNAGKTPLYIAAAVGHREVVDALINANADVSHTRNFDISPLSIAADMGHFEVMDALIEAGANVNQTDKEGVTLLYIAVEQGHLERVEALITAGADVNQPYAPQRLTPLSTAAYYNHLEVVEALINANANVNQANDERVTPLSYAAEKGHIGVVNILIKARADVNQANDEGITPLSYAAEKGHIGVVNALIIARANVNQADDKGITPLSYAAENGHIGVVNALIIARANINQADKKGLTPLFKATEKGHLEVMDALTSKNAHIGNLNFFVNLLNQPYQNLLLKLDFRNATQLQNGIVFLAPDTKQFPCLMINSSMIIALESAYQFLTHNKEQREVAVIRELIARIKNDIHKSFSNHVLEWKSAISQQDTKKTNAEILSESQDYSSTTSDNSVGNSLLSNSIFITASEDSFLKEKNKTDTELFIDQLVIHSKHWSESEKNQETLALTNQSNKWF